MRRFLARLIAFYRVDRAETDLAREIDAHLRLLEDGFVAQGMSPQHARDAAKRAFGGVEQVKEHQRDARSFRWLGDARHDARYAFRVLLRSPGFAAAAVATLALGIGASTAIFSVAYGTSIRPLPYPAPERLVRIYEANPANGQLKHDVSVGAFHGWRAGAPSLESAALFSKPRTRFVAGADPVAVTVMSVSPGFFDVLGVRPLLGPGFQAEQAYTRFTGEDEAVLSFSAWQRLFGGQPDVVGRQVALTGISSNQIIRVVGVMPEGFAFDQPVDLWQPSEVVELPVRRLFRIWRYDGAVGRLRPETSIEQLRAEVEAVAARLAREYPASNEGWTATVESLHESIVGAFGRATWLLVAAVAVVLLVACLNVGGLLVARAVARERETLVRIALGAGAWRLLRLWLAESSLLGALGAGLGILLAWLGVSALKAAAPPGIPRLEAVAIDLPVLGVAVGAALLAVLIATVAPLVAARRRDVARGLRAGSASAGDGPKRHAVRNGLTAAQCAGAATLVVLALMFTRSFIRLTSVDLGWDPAGVLTLRVDPPMPANLQRPWARYVEWSDRLIARLEATPGIRRAAITTQVPLSGQFFPSTLAKGRGAAAGNDAKWPGVMHVVSDGYLDAMGIRVISGRTFGRVDRFSAAQLIGAEGVERERGVAIISESTARSLWPGRPAIGEALWLPDSDNVTWREVIGIVEDIHFHAVGEKPAMHVFVPYTQFTSANPRLVVRGDGTAASLVAVVRPIVADVEPGTHIDQVAPLDALVSRATAQSRFTSRVVALFGGLALLLAAVGIYGTLSYVVRAHTREIGIRLALGASRSNILSQTVRRGLLPAAGGGVMGLALAVGLARTFRGLFFDLSPLDLSSFIAGAFVILVVALGATLGPARRASQVDPAAALRTE